MAQKKMWRTEFKRAGHSEDHYMVFARNRKEAIALGRESLQADYGFKDALDAILLDVYLMPHERKTIKQNPTDARKKNSSRPENPQREEIRRQIARYGYAIVREKTSGEGRQVFGDNIDLSRFEVVDMTDKPIKNPASRIGTARQRRHSQITKKPPSQRLIKRREKNTKKGYFPNPAKTVLLYGFIVLKKERSSWISVASFKNKKDSLEYAQALADKQNVQVKVLDNR